MVGAVRMSRQKLAGRHKDLESLPNRRLDVAVLARLLQR